MGASGPCGVATYGAFLHGARRCVQLSNSASAARTTRMVIRYRSLHVPRTVSDVDVIDVQREHIEEPAKREEQENENANEHEDGD